jgi:hypothetical protein
MREKEEVALTSKCQIDKCSFCLNGKGRFKFSKDDFFQ